VWYMLATFLPKHMLSALGGGELSEPGQRAYTQAGCAAAIFVHVVFGTQAIRWGRKAIGRYQGTIEPSSILDRRRISSGVRRIVAGLIAVFGAALWSGALFYLLSTAHSRKGNAPDWVPSQYHSVWKSIYNNEGILNLPYQIIGVLTLLLVGLVLIGRNIRLIRASMGTT